MIDSSLKVKLENVRKLIRRDAKTHLHNILAKIHHADIAFISSHLSDLDRRKLWKYITDNEKLSEVILDLDDHDILTALDEIEPKTVASILNLMDSDDTSHILRLVPAGQLEEYLKYLKKEELLNVEKLLHYKEGTAGAIMNTAFFAINCNTTVKEATKSLHLAEHLEMVFYLYIVDDDNKLVGVLSLRQLILNPPTRKLADIMVQDVVTANLVDEQEQVANYIDKYDLLAIPVVDEHHRLCGIITVDDIIDFIRDKAHEDIYNMAGINQEELQFSNKPIKAAKTRLPWLIVTFVGEMFSGLIITFFQGRVTDFLILATFMPIIMAMGGNVGSQSATVIIRGIALGKIDMAHTRKVIFNELKIGLIMGIVIGLLLALIAPLLQSTREIGLIVGIALFSAILFASFTGATVPIILTKLKFDPAVASTPFISTLNDITGLTIYFSVSLLLLSIL